jgi:hypothetical protein
MESPFSAKHVAKIERKHDGRTYVSYLLRQAIGEDQGRVGRGLVDAQAEEATDQRREVDVPSRSVAILIDEAGETVAVALHSADGEPAGHRLQVDVGQFGDGQVGVAGQSAPRSLVE